MAELRSDLRWMVLLNYKPDIDIEMEHRCHDLESSMTAAEELTVLDLQHHCLDW